METSSLFINDQLGSIPAIINCPENPIAWFTFAHGAGAGMDHVFMTEVSQRLFDRNIATLRYNFPYMAQGRKMPDRPPKLLPAVKIAIQKTLELAGGLPVYAGGKSMGGRMTSTFLSENEVDHVAGIIFLGFPLHPAKKASTTRADHLKQIKMPMLFLQGTRDKLAELPLITEVSAGLSSATLNIIDGADHGFHVLKRSGRNDNEVLEEIIEAIINFIKVNKT